MSKCRIFRDRINECKLIDMKVVGPKFTWRGSTLHGGQQIYERFDRVLSYEGSCDTKRRRRNKIKILKNDEGQ